MLIEPNKKESAAGAVSCQEDRESFLAVVPKPLGKLNLTFHRGHLTQNPVESTLQNFPRAKKKNKITCQDDSQLSSERYLFLPADDSSIHKMSVPGSQRAAGMAKESPLNLFFSTPTKTAKPPAKNVTRSEFRNLGVSNPRVLT